MTILWLSFNTSYVSVQAFMSITVMIISKVSIHPMFRFKIFIFYKNYCVQMVSIHPMFRFKNFFIVSIASFNSLFQYILCFGSSKSLFIGYFYASVFQYILCFGSRRRERIRERIAGMFQYILCFGSSFITRINVISHPAFQYILCFGSRKPLRHLNK